MASVNKVIIIGNLGQDPELKELKNGKVCRLNVATTRYWKDKDGDKREETEWHRISVWGKQAEACDEYLEKGRAVYVEGRLRTTKYRKDDEETDRYSTEIVAERVQFLGSKNDGNSGGKSKKSKKSREEDFDDDDDDIDF